MADRVKESLAQQSLDMAFARHVGSLFEDFCANIKQEGPKRIPANSHAREEFRRQYAFAVTTYREMSEDINAAS